MSRTKSDYQRNQGSGLFTRSKELYRNLEIALPFFGFASTIVHTIVKQQLDNAKGETSNENLGIAKIANSSKAVNYCKQDVSIEEHSFRNLGEAEKKKYYEEELCVAKEAEDRAAERRACRNLGIVYRSLGKLDEAVKYHEHELDIAKELGDRVGEQFAYRNLGIAHRSFRNFGKAVECHQQELSIAKDLGDSTGVGLANENLAIAYIDLRNFDDAIQCDKQVLSIVKEVRDMAGQVRAYGRLGIACRNLRKLDEAIEYHEKELNIAKEVGDRASEGRAKGNLGMAYLDQRNLNEAIKYHKQELGIANEISSRDGEKHACACLGIAYRCRGDLEKSIEHHEHELSLAKEGRDRAGEGRAFENLGITYRNLRNLNKAIHCHGQELEIAKEVGDRAGEGRANGNLGVDYLDRRDFEKAIEYHKLELRIAQEVKDRAGERRAVGNLGIAYGSRGGFNEAIKFHNQELNLAKDAKDKAGEGQACCNLGIAYLYSGDLDKAIENHKEELSIAKEVGDRVAEGSANGGLGIAYHRSGKYDDAINNYEESLKIAKEVGNKVGICFVLCHLGSVYDSRGDYQNAIKRCREALKIAKTNNDTAGKALANGNLGNAFANLGDFETAKKHHREQLRLSTDDGIEDKYTQVRAYCNLGNDYRNIPGCFAKGMECDRKSLKIAIEEKDRRGEMCAKGSLGTAYHCLADFEEAKKCHNKHIMIAQELGDRKEEGRAYTNLGNVYRSLKDFDQAKLLHQKGLTIAEEVEDMVGKGDALYSLGRDSECVGSLLEALQYHHSCVNLYNDVRANLQSEDKWKMYFRDQHKDAYIALWETLVKLQRTDEALCEAEKGRAQDLNDLLKLRFGYTDKHEAVRHIVRNISTQTVFLALGSNKINFWVFRKGDEIRFRQKETDVAAALQHLNKNVCTAIEAHDSDVQSKVTSLSILYDTIIGPIEDLLKGDELIIIPDGPLFFVPYAALLNHEEPTAKYLGEYVRIRILPSLTSLKIITDREDYHSKPEALLVGNPTNPTESNPKSLSYADREVDGISTIIGRSIDAQVLKNQEATKEAVLNRIHSFALIHFAAHGQINTGEIELAQKNQSDDDNVLMMEDVQNKKLTARLVVLSCCNTGRGNVSAEGVVGIARAFLCAGARSVLASLWKIDDDSTMKFMTNFYQHLVDGKSASVALQLAMKHLRDALKEDEDEEKKNHAEKYWAPFVLIGDDVTLKFGESE